MPKPYVKWCGGKGKLLPRLIPLVPPSFNRYEEPFAGGAAMFWALGPRVACLNDANPHLINAYRVVRDDVEALIADLSTRTYDRAEFMRTRELFNSAGGSTVWRAATFIYINRCGFNGLWRVNSSGGCNVPFGKYDNPTICDADNLRACSAAIRGVEIRNDDFGGVEERVGLGDFVYCDSPYVPASKTANFTGYTADGFGKSDQERLAEMLRRLARRGVHWMSSNSDTPLVRELYAGFRIVELTRSGNISCKGTGRQRVGEVVVLGGTWEPRTRAAAALLTEAP